MRLNGRAPLSPGQIAFFATRSTYHPGARDGRRLWVCQRHFCGPLFW